MPQSFKTLILLICSISLWMQAAGQQKKLSTRNKKAISFYEDALIQFNRRMDPEGCDLLEKALMEDEKFHEARIVLADMFLDMGKFEQAEIQFEKLIALDKNFFPRSYLRLSIAQLSMGKYEKAKENLHEFLKLKDIMPDQRKKAETLLGQAEVAIQLKANPVPFNPKNLGSNINTEHYEYFPSITTDGQNLVFTRNIRGEKGHHQEDFYASYLKNGVWGKAYNIGPPVNTTGNEGAQCISADGQWIFFTACNRQGGQGSCDIYLSRKTADGWTEPKNPGQPLNSAKWESQPGFSVDGKTLYFASNRPGGKGKMDIWYSSFTPNQGWSEPKNLEIINTAGDEQSPFIHPDDQTLYFSSDGLPGMGKQDLYYCRRKMDGSWSQPINLGYPINTFADEQSLIVSARGDTAYISADYEGGFGKLDIYNFPLYEAARPLTVSYFKGKIIDKESRENLEAQFDLIDIETGQLKARAGSNAGTGEFLVSLPINRNYALNVSKNGYLFYSENFEMKGASTAAKPMIKNIELSPVKAGEKLVLRNLFFDTNKFDLKPESETELRKLLELLQQNPTLKVEISGHTDNVGNKQANKQLSESRAKSVSEYLIQKGIDRSRLSPKGYGDEQPIDTNETPEGRANNRRTEMTIL